MKTIINVFLICSILAFLYVGYIMVYNLPDDPIALGQQQTLFGWSALALLICLFAKTRFR
ncbi:hypothetical protein J2T17_004406 [Paenibacillus mucilaginosus]|uniref:hypothetical protein n=1 Tax=Paenibacillus mucilaginosus TaxID=61624 RepID=UPI003D21B607